MLGCSGTLGEPSKKGAADGDGELGDEESLVENFSDVSLETPLVRRLTRDEVEFTLEDSLGLELSDAEMAEVPRDRPLEGFTNIATSQTAGPSHALGYASLGEVVVSKLDWSSFVDEHANCTSDDAACRKSYVDSVGSMLFRRPVAADESEAFASLFGSVLEQEGADFELAAQAVLRAMLQAPQFIYRIEKETAQAVGEGAQPGEQRAVDGYEMATRLSYLLWASAPDQELLQAAATGELDTVEGVVVQVERLLDNQGRARRVTSRYMRDWGRLEALPDDAGLRTELIDSVVATYNAMLWDQKASLLELFTAQEYLLTSKLADNYGLSPSGEGLRSYDIVGLSGRMGLLTHPGLIAGMTNADGGAIVARGLFLQTQLFCQETPSPPTQIQDEIDAFVEELPEDASDRYIAETRLERPECGTCHGGFDPLAYGLEQFDYQGRFRTEDEHGNPMTTDGWIPGRVRRDGGDLRYETVKEYAAMLAEEPAVQACITRHHFKYAIGRVLEREHAPVIDRVYDDFIEAGGTYRAMMLAIAKHDLFRKMTLE